MPGLPPPEVLAAAHGAFSTVTGTTVAGPVQWVRVNGGYLVQIPLTTPVNCEGCSSHAERAATPHQSPGAVLEVQVPAGGVPPAAPPAATASPGSAQPGGSSDYSAGAQSRTRLLSLKQATDLSRYGPVGEFTLLPRRSTGRFEPTM
jgi:hypothetical protein